MLEREREKARPVWNDVKAQTHIHMNINCDRLTF